MLAQRAPRSPTLAFALSVRRVVIVTRLLMSRPASLACPVIAFDAGDHAQRLHLEGGGVPEPDGDHALAAKLLCEEVRVQHALGALGSALGRIEPLLPHLSQVRLLHERVLHRGLRLLVREQLRDSDGRPELLWGAAVLSEQEHDDPEGGDDEPAVQEPRLKNLRVVAP